MSIDEELKQSGLAAVFHDFPRQGYICSFGGKTYKVSGRLEKMSNCNRMMILRDHPRLRYGQVAKIEDVLASERFDRDA